MRCGSKAGAWLVKVTQVYLLKSDASPKASSPAPKTSIADLTSKPLIAKPFRALAQVFGLDGFHGTGFAAEPEL